MNRRAFLHALGGLALVACDNSCDRDKGTPISGGSIPDPSKRPTSPIGYSNVATLNAAEARAIVAAGCTLMQAELIPFDREVAHLDVSDTRANWERVKGAVAVARASNCTFWLTLVNWNGAGQRAQSDAWFQAQLDTALREVGPAGVWLEGVTEPDGNDAKAVRWLTLATKSWPGITMNERVSVGSTLRCRHYCSTEALIAGVKERGDIVHSTDCGPALASTMSDVDILEVTREAKARGRGLLLYDTDNAPTANGHVLEVMREALLA